MKTTNTNTQINEVEFYIDKTSSYSTNKEDVLEDLYALSNNSGDWMDFSKQDLINLRDLLIRLLPGD